MLSTAGEIECRRLALDGSKWNLVKYFIIRTHVYELWYSYKKFDKFNMSLQHLYFDYVHRELIGFLTLLIGFLIGTSCVVCVR